MTEEYYWQSTQSWNMAGKKGGRYPRNWHVCDSTAGLSTTFNGFPATLQASIACELRRLLYGKANECLAKPRCRLLIEDYEQNPFLERTCLPHLVTLFACKHVWKQLGLTHFRITDRIVSCVLLVQRMRLANKLRSMQARIQRPVSQGVGKGIETKALSSRLLGNRVPKAE